MPKRWWSLGQRTDADAQTIAALRQVVEIGHPMSQLDRVVIREMEAIIGQIYLAVLVARLVGLYIAYVMAGDP